MNLQMIRVTYIYIYYGLAIFSVQRVHPQRTTLFYVIAAYCYCLLLLWLNQNGKAHAHRIFANIDNYRERQTIESEKEFFIFSHAIFRLLSSTFRLIFVPYRVDKVHEREVKCHTFIINYFFFHFSSWQVCVLGIVFDVSHNVIRSFTLTSLMQMKQVSSFIFIA